MPKRYKKNAKKRKGKTDVKKKLMLKTLNKIKKDTVYNKNIQLGNKTFINLCAFNNRCQNHKAKKNPLEMQIGYNKNTVLERCFNSLLSELDISNKQKVSRSIDEMIDTTNNLE